MLYQPIRSIALHREFGRSDAQADDVQSDDDGPDVVSDQKPLERPDRKSLQRPDAGRDGESHERPDVADYVGESDKRPDVVPDLK